MTAENHNSVKAIINKSN